MKVNDAISLEGLKEEEIKLAIAVAEAQGFSISNRVSRLSKVVTVSKDFLFITGTWLDLGNNNLNLKNKLTLQEWCFADAPEEAVAIVKTQADDDKHCYYYIDGNFKAKGFYEDEANFTAYHEGSLIYNAPIILQRKGVTCINCVAFNSIEPFECEDRYIVLKRKDVEKYLSREQISNLAGIVGRINGQRAFENKGIIDAVVVEKKWSEELYEKVWELIENYTRNTELFETGRLPSQVKKEAPTPPYIPKVGDEVMFRVLGGAPYEGKVLYYSSQYVIIDDYENKHERSFPRSNLGQIKPLPSLRVRFMERAINLANEHGEVVTLEAAGLLYDAGCKFTE